MKKKIAHISYCYCILLILVCGNTYAQNTLLTKQYKLKHVTQQIHTLQKKLTDAKKKKLGLQAKLQKTEIKIGGLSKNLNLTNYKLKHVKKLITQNQQKQTQLKASLTKQQKLLTKQLRAAYLFGQQPYLKLLLNEKNPSKIERYLEYYQYFQRSRINTIKHINKLTQQLKQTEHTIRKNMLNLEQMRKAENKQQHLLENKRYQRQHLLNTTIKTIQTKNQQLKKLSQDKRQLTKIINDLIKQMAYQYAPGAHFVNMRGKLHWPILHKHIIQHFGATILHSELHTTGILISAKSGTQVHAIFSGKVIFADWLRGFGLLVILQHGHNYLSLYGHNQSLYVKPGQTIQPGQIIATAGNSGGFSQNALYFEIRHQSTPVNPLFWLTKT